MFEDQIQFFIHFAPGEQRAPTGHLVEDATDSPHVDRSEVFRTAQKHIGRSIPQSDHFVRVGLRRKRFDSCQTEISQFQFTPLVDQEILRSKETPTSLSCILSFFFHSLQISMEDLPRMAIVETA